MSQTNEWGDPAPDNEWGATTTEEPTWGDAAPTAAEPQGNPWGSDEEDTPTQAWDAVPESPNAWGATSDATAPSPAEPNSWDATDDDPPYDAPEARGSYNWSEDTQDESPLGRFEEEPKRESRVPVKLLAIIGTAVVALLIVGFGVVGAISGGGDEPEPPPAEETSAVDPELAQFETFAQQLQDALNERDATAYHALMSKESQTVVTAEDTQAAVDALAPGAQYEVVLVNGSAAGQTATVKLTLVRTLAGDVTESPMTAQLAKEGEDWKMVVRPNDQ